MCCADNIDGECRWVFPDEPSHWCSECQDDLVAALEARSEGDR